jgi:hypothetical protein
MRAVHRWFDEIERKDAMQETFIRFVTYLIAPAPQAGVSHTSHNAGNTSPITHTAQVTFHKLFTADKDT